MSATGQLSPLPPSLSLILTDSPFPISLRRSTSSSCITNRSSTYHPPHLLYSRTTTTCERCIPRSFSPLSLRLPTFPRLNPSLLSQGATVHSFDPSATPQEKASQISNGPASANRMDMSGIPSLRGPELREFKEKGGEGLTSDIGTSGERIEVTTGLDGVERANKEEGEKVGEVERARQSRIDEGRLNEEDGTENPPGAMPKKEAEPNMIRESASNEILSIRSLTEH